MELTPERIKRGKGIAYSLLGMGIVFNLLALTITVYMLENFSWLIYEANPIPAFVFANYGYAPMLLIISMFWVTVFALLRYWGRRYGSSKQLFLAFGFAVVLTSITFLDFANNFYYLTKVCLPTLII